MSATLRHVSWAVMAFVIAVALVIGATGDRAPQTESERVLEIASTVRCPTCRQLSAAESDAIAAQAVRDAIRERLRAGDSEEEIRAFLVSRYTESILLKPPATGVSALVWVLPVAAGVVATAGLVVVFRRWRRQQPATPTAEDRRLVDDALRG